MILNNDSEGKDQYLALSITLVGLALIITLLPAFLLVCYPMKLFQRLLSKLRLNCNILWKKKFYSCYKDGLNGGGRDMRSFVGFFFLLRYILCLLFLLHIICLFLVFLFKLYFELSVTWFCNLLSAKLKLLAAQSVAEINVDRGISGERHEVESLCVACATSTCTAHVFLNSYPQVLFSVLCTPSSWDL